MAAGLALHLTELMTVAQNSTVSVTVVLPDEIAPVAITVSMTAALVSTVSVTVVRPSRKALVAVSLSMVTLMG